MQRLILTLCLLGLNSQMFSAALALRAEIRSVAPHSSDGPRAVVDSVIPQLSATDTCRQWAFVCKRLLTAKCHCLLRVEWLLLLRCGLCCTLLSFSLLLDFRVVLLSHANEINSRLRLISSASELGAGRGFMKVQGGASVVWFWAAVRRN